MTVLLNINYASIFHQSTTNFVFYFVTVSVLFIKMSPKKFRTKKRAAGKKGLRKLLLNNLKNKRP